MQQGEVCNSISNEAGVSELITAPRQEHSVIQHSTFFFFYLRIAGYGLFMVGICKWLLNPVDLESSAII